MRTCEFEGCNKVHIAKGLCGGHYQQQKNGKQLTPLGATPKSRKYDTICSFPECDKEHRSRGLCAGHYQQFKDGKELTEIIRKEYPETCTVEWCDRPHKAVGFCGAHYQQNKIGLELKPVAIRRTAAEMAEQASRGVRECLDCRVEFPLTTEFFYLNNGPSQRKGQWQSRCKRCEVGNRLKTQYGMTLETWEAMLESQGNACAICRTDDPGKLGNWQTDHDHKCCPGKVTCGGCVRAILCWNCNLTVGFVENHDNVALVMQYITDPALHLQLIVGDKSSEGDCRLSA